MVIDMKTNLPFINDLSLVHLLATTRVKVYNSTVHIAYSDSLREKHFLGRLQIVCRGGSANRPYERVAINHAFVGAVPRPPLQIYL